MRYILKYTNSFVDRFGKVRTYLRLPGKPAIALPGVMGSREMLAAYNDAMATQPAQGSRDAPGSVASVIASFLASPGFLKLARASRTAYAYDLAHLNEAHGEALVDDLQPKHVRQQLAALEATPSAGIARLRALRLVWKHATKLGIVDRPDPCTGIERPTLDGEGYKAWSATDIAQFEAKHGLGSMAVLAVRLAAYTGMRRADLIKLRHADIKADGIHTTAQKTGKKLILPVHAKLQEALDATTLRGIDVVLVAASGRAFSPGAFSDQFARWVREAGLSDLSCHGVRKFFATALAQTGASVHQIAACTGHADLGMVAHYSKSVDQKQLAADAMAKLA